MELSVKEKTNGKVKLIPQESQTVAVRQKPRFTVAMITYIFPPDFGGRAIQAIQVAKALRRLGVHSFFAAANLSDAADFEMVEGSPVYRYRSVSVPRFEYLIYMFKVSVLLFKKRKSYDLIHFHSIKPFSFLITGLAKLLGKPTFISLSLIGNDDPQALKMKSFLWALEARLYKKLDRLNCESTALKNSCLHENIPAEKISQIPCGVDEFKFARPESELEKKEIRKRLNLPEEAFICLFVGRLSTRKGCDLLFEAWENVYQKNKKDFFLVLVGPYGEHRYITDEQREFDKKVQSYLQSADGLGMEFTGQVEVDETAQYFKAADCFLFPSKTEGFGIVTIEAMACGLPVIATRIEGVTGDIISHRKEGIILEEREPRLLAEAILELQKDKELYSKLSENAVNKVKKRFTLTAVAEQHAEQYEQLIIQKNA